MSIIIHNIYMYIYIYLQCILVFSIYNMIYIYIGDNYGIHSFSQQLFNHSCSRMNQKRNHIVIQFLPPHVGVSCRLLDVIQWIFFLSENVPWIFQSLTNQIDRRVPGSIFPPILGVIHFAPKRQKGKPCQIQKSETRILKPYDLSNGYFFANEKRFCFPPETIRFRVTDGPTVIFWP